ncbi:MAG: hypothetical protein KA354_22135 [Phycisphaerae bacterium]|nr:hypothetical protein [Phycisphaerae bacterium]
MVRRPAQDRMVVERQSKPACEVHNWHRTPACRFDRLHGFPPLPAPKNQRYALALANWPEHLRASESSGDTGTPATSHVSSSFTVTPRYDLLSWRVAQN